MKPIIVKGNDFDKILPLMRLKWQNLSFDKTYKIEISEQKNKRSLDANAYCWTLITKIAETISESKENVYKSMLRDYGQQFIAKIPFAHIDLFKRSNKYYQEHEKLIDEKAVYYRVFVGSSNYNTFEMSKLIDGIVQECKQLDIETLTPSELSTLMQDWGS